MIDEERIKELSKEFFAASRPTVSEDVAAPQAVADKVIADAEERNK